jgi:hypothetical protein
MYEVRCDIREDTRLTALEVKAMHDTTMQYCMDHGYGFRETWDGMLATIPPGTATWLAQRDGVGPGKVERGESQRSR